MIETAPISIKHGDHAHLPALNTTFAYDDIGNTLSETAGTAVTSYTWDRDNRLRAVTPPAPGVPTSYSYDTNGLRVQRVDGTGTTRYLLDRHSVLAELDGTSSVTTRFLNNPQYMDDIISFERAGATYHPLTDGLGSIYAVTDASGAAVRRFDFDAFGVRANLGGTGPVIDAGYTGRWHDANGLVEHRLRQRRAEMGGWLQVDPAGMIDGPNMYSYARANPVMGMDPWGKNWNATQIAHASVAAAATIALSMLTFAFFSGMGRAWVDMMGIEVYLAAASATLVLEGGYAWEQYFYNPSDATEDLVADALGAFAGAVVWLVITSVVAPRNLAWASLLVGGAILGGGLETANLCHRYFP